MTKDVGTQEEKVNQLSSGQCNRTSAKWLLQPSRHAIAMHTLP